MKKFIIKVLTASICLIFITLSGCDSNSVYKISDYMPVKADTLYTFVGDNDDEGYVVFNHYIDGNRYQRRLMAASTATIEVLEHENGELKLVYGEARMFNYKSFLDKEPNQDVLILKEPLELNQSWIQFSGAGGDVIAEITALDKEISIPHHNNLKTMEVTITYPDGKIFVEYYAKGLGRVRSDSISTITTTDENSNIISQEQFDKVVVLAEVEEHTPLGTRFAIFYPNENGRLTYKVKPIEFATNSDSDEVFLNTLRPILNEAGNISLSDSTRILKNDSDVSNGLLTIEMTKSFADDMKNSAVGEKLAFESMVNTLAYFNYCSAVKIIIDGEEYRPADVEFDEEGFAWLVDYDES